MTDKEQIICKYKFKNKEKFNSKPYCLCHNELCEDLFYVCEHNCQIYEDYKQLISKTQECEELKNTLEKLTRGVVLPAIPEPNVINLTNRYRKALEDIQIFTGKIISNDDRPACVYDVECPLNGGVGFDNHCNENCPFILAKQILDIINKAKGEE